MDTTTENITAMALTWPEKARSVKIERANDYAQAGEMVKSLRGLRNQVKESFDPIIKSAHESHKKALEQKAKADRPLDEAEKILVKAMQTWQMEQERIRREEEARIREKLRKEEEDRMLEMALRAEKEGNSKIADQIISAPVFAPNIIVPSDVPYLKGISSRDVWKARVVNFALVPREYLIVDEQKIGQIARTMKGELRIPGIEFYSEKSTTVRV